MVPRRILWIATVLVFLGAIPATEPAWATCGGGGGGGKGGSGSPYKTQWTKDSWSNVLSSAKSKKEGVVLYFEPESGIKSHRFFQTKVPNDASKERKFFKVDGDDEEKEAEALRDEYAVNRKRHVVYVCDWYGNSLKSFQRTTKTKFKGRTIKDTLYGMAKLSKRLNKKLRALTTTAEKATARGSYASAIKAASEVLRYKGYPAVSRAGAVRGRIVAEGEKELEAALQLEEPARAKRLKALKRKFKRTTIEARCQDALDGRREEEKETQRRGEDGATMALAREAWDELFGGIDYETLPPTTAERVDRAMRNGYAHELAGRYERARKSYALAAGLDVEDPLPLVYLGELYRHHLGLWDEAGKVLRRVIAMNHDAYTVAIALHGIGKMTIWRGDNKKGLALLQRSVDLHPTPLCYRNLAVFWNTEGEREKAFAYARKAYELDPQDSYNQVFLSVYLLLNGRKQEARRLIAAAEFDPSMSYNYACFHAVQGKKDRALYYLKRHFYEYEQFDEVRAFEMAEARMDAFFEPWKDDPAFLRLTALAGKTPWLDPR